MCNNEKSEDTDQETFNNPESDNNEQIQPVFKQSLSLGKLLLSLSALAIVIWLASFLARPTPAKQITKYQKWYPSQYNNFLYVNLNTMKYPLLQDLLLRSGTKIKPGQVKEFIMVGSNSLPDVAIVSLKEKIDFENFVKEPAFKQFKYKNSKYWQCRNDFITRINSNTFVMTKKEEGIKKLILKKDTVEEPSENLSTLMEMAPSSPDFLSCISQEKTDDNMKGYFLSGNASDNNFNFTAKILFNDAKAAKSYDNNFEKYIKKRIKICYENPLKSLLNSIEIVSLGDSVNLQYSISINALNQKNIFKYIKEIINFGRMEKISQNICSNNLKMIGLSLLMYSRDNNKQFPSLDGAQGLDLLRSEGFLENPKVYVCPGEVIKPATKGAKLTEDTVSYVYFGGMTEASSVDFPLAFDKPGNHIDYVNILFNDGHVKAYSGKFDTCEDVINSLNLDMEDKRLLIQKAKEADRRLRR